MMFADYPIDTRRRGGFTKWKKPGEHGVSKELELDSDEP